MKHPSLFPALNYWSVFCTDTARCVNGMQSLLGYGGDTISAWNDATLPNHVAALNQRKHCNLSWWASLKIPRTFWSAKMFCFYLDSSFTSTRHWHKKKKRNEKMKRLHTWMLKCSLLIPWKQLCGFSSCGLIKSSVSGKLTSLICPCKFFSLLC